MTNEKLGIHLLNRLLEASPKGVTLTALKAAMIGSAYGHCSRKRILKVLLELEKLYVVRVTEMKRRPGEFTARMTPMRALHKLDRRRETR
ncbi:MAG: hypothetical protein KAJ07_10580 [Planctomycetes bacterium]|nr:hypothetical protein [Planctomycetota bacterium]